MRRPSPKRSSRRRTFVLAALLLTPVSLSGVAGGPLGGLAPASASTSVTPMVASFGDHTCVLLANGTVRCWGDNASGQLGDGTTINRVRPVTVVRPEAEGGGALTGVTAISTGSGHTCALMDDGAVRCWGQNRRGQLGVSTPAVGAESDPRPHPVTVDGLTGVTAITAGGNHTCALLGTSPTTVRCWGGNQEGQLGNGMESFGANPTPTAVYLSGTSGPELTGVTRIAAGSEHSCAIIGDGVTATARCWGSNSSEQLGDGTSVPLRANPVEVVSVADGAALSGTTGIAAGSFHTCALLADGTVRCWGDNSARQLGDATTAAKRSVPIAITGLSGVAALTTGSGSLCGLTAGGAVQCWGANDFGQLGRGAATAGGVPSPGPVFLAGTSGTTLEGVSSIAPSNHHTCALVGVGGGSQPDVRCWGRNDVGQLGDGTSTNRLNPVAVVWTEPIVEDASDPGTASPTRPSVVCAPSVIMVGTQVTCTITGGQPGIDILWRATVNPVIASEGVTLDRDGNGNFTFMAPASARGRVVAVELVAWTAPVAIGAGPVGGPIPSSVPAGEGSMHPNGTLAAVVVALLGSVALTGVLSGIAPERRASAPR